MSVGRRRGVALLLALAAAFLAGCASLSGVGGEAQYACPIARGVRCGSVTANYLQSLRAERPVQAPGVREEPAPVPESAVPTPAPTAVPTATLTAVPVTSAVTAPVSAHQGASAIPEPVDPSTSTAIVPNTAPASTVVTTPVPPLVAITASTGTPSTSTGLASADPAPPLRSPPRVLRLWIAPWEDRDGVLRDSAFVFVPIDHGHWLVDRVRSATRPGGATAPPLPREDRTIPTNPPAAETGVSRPAQGAPAVQKERDAR